MTKLNQLIEEQERDAKSRRVLVEYSKSKDSSIKPFYVENPGVYYGLQVFQYGQRMKHYGKAQEES
ncbi:MAG: hypothetical protein IMZ70_05900 [Candidatus Atribacteria bacterium]|nr:hypothetical protein [Candidatus Atribacteria bacterium]